VPSGNRLEIADRVVARYPSRSWSWGIPANYFVRGYAHARRRIIPRLISKCADTTYSFARDRTVPRRRLNDSNTPRLRNVIPVRRMSVYKYWSGCCNDYQQRSQCVALWRWHARTERERERERALRLSDCWDYLGIISNQNPWSVAALSANVISSFDTRVLCFIFKSK